MRRIIIILLCISIITMIFTWDGKEPYQQKWSTQAILDTIEQAPNIITGIKEAISDINENIGKDFDENIPEWLEPLSTLVKGIAYIVEDIVLTIGLTIQAIIYIGYWLTQIFI